MSAAAACFGVIELLDIPPSPSPMVSERTLLPASGSSNLSRSALCVTVRRHVSEDRHHIFRMDLCRHALDHFGHWHWPVCTAGTGGGTALGIQRSEERRVGKECR